MIQFIHNPLQYIRSIKRILTSFLLILIPIVVLKPCPCDEIWWKQISAVTVVIAWITMLLSLGQFPAFGVYIVMFSTVAENVLKFLGLYMLLLIAFAFGFHVLLRPYSTFKTLFTSFSTTFVMMTGELDYEAVFITEGRERVGSLCIVALLLFIFLVYIILSNLLVGLAVSDMTAIRRRSEMVRLTTEVELMMQFEGLVRSHLLPSPVQNFMKKSICLTKLGKTPIICIMPNETRGWVTTIYRILSNILGKKLLNKIFESFVDGFIPPVSETSIPMNLIEASLNIALRQFEIDKRDRLLQLSNRKATVNTDNTRLPTSHSMKRVTFSCQNSRDIFSDKKSYAFVKDSDESSSTDHSDPLSETQSLLNMPQYLSLKKASRHNRFDDLLLPDPYPMLDPDELRQTLIELRMTLDSLEGYINPSFNSRRQSMHSRTFTTDEI